MIVREENPNADRRDLYKAARNHLKYFSHIQYDHNFSDEDVYFLTELQQLDMRKYVDEKEGAMQLRGSGDDD